MTNTSARRSAAVEKVVAALDDASLDARYPNCTHFIDADNPDQGLLASRALIGGDPVAIVHRDGNEVLLTPEPTLRLVGMLLFLAGLWIGLRKRSWGGDLVQLTPRVRIEARDASGLPRAA